MVWYLQVGQFNQANHRIFLEQNNKVIIRIFDTGPGGFGTTGEITQVVESG